MNLRFLDEAVDLTIVEIETGRLQLNRMSTVYARDVFENFTDEITKFMMPAPASEISETEAWIDATIRASKEGSELHVAICDKENGEFLGVCGLNATENTAEVELGIWLKATARGNRYGLEAMEGLIRWASANLVCERFIYPVDRRNAPSWRIAERLNGTIIAERRVENMSGNILDEVVYRIPPIPTSSISIISSI